MGLSDTLFKHVLGVNNLVIEGIRIEEVPRPDSAGAAPCAGAGTRATTPPGGRNSGGSLTSTA